MARPQKATLSSTHPHLAAELLDPLDGENHSAGSGATLEWICPAGHVWSTQPSQRTKKAGSNCPFCSGRRVLRGFNDLATTHPDIAAEMADGSLALELSAGSGKKVMWVCPLAHTWEASVVSRTGGNGCPYCGNRKLLCGFNDLASRCPELSQEMANPALAKTYMFRSNSSVEWVCRDCGSTYCTPIASRVVRGTGCPKCGRRRGEPMSKTAPEMAAELLNTRDGEKFSRCSNTRLEWLCAECGNTWFAAPYNRWHAKSGCPACAVAPATALSESHPALTMELVDPDLGQQLSAGSSRIVTWRCPEGHEWAARVSQRAGLATGCPTCWGRNTEPLGVTHPGLASELVDTGEAGAATAGSARKLLWRCGEGHQWRAQIASRVYGRGCPICAERGYNPSRDGTLYVLMDLVFEQKIVQFGISNVPKDRLSTHRRTGFISPPIGAVTGGGVEIAELEKSIKRERVSRGIPNCTERGLKFDGSTESFIVDSPEAHEFLDWIMGMAHLKAA